MTSKRQSGGSEGTVGLRGDPGSAEPGRFQAPPDFASPWPGPHQRDHTECLDSATSLCTITFRTGTS